jgi:hypothetical protein
MKVKKEYLVLLLIIIGLSIYLLQRTGDRTLYKLPAIPPVAKSDITKIQIEQGDEDVELTKKDDRWWIAPEHYPADSSRIQGMLDVLDDLTLTALVAQSGDDMRYELDDEKKISVKAWQQDRLVRDFEIGKTAPSFRHTFVKLAGDKRVFHARGNLRSRFDQTIDQLRDKQVLSFNIEDIQQIQIVDGGSTLELALSRTAADEESPPDDSQTAEGPSAAGGIWQTEDGKSAVQEKVNQLLRSLSALKCQTFIEDKNEFDFTRPIRTINLTGPEKHSLRIYAKISEDAQDYPATSSDSDDPFTLSSSQTEPILSPLTDFLGK